MSSTLRWFLRQLAFCFALHILLVASFDQDVQQDATITPSANVTVPLYVHSGSHHVHLYIGSPPQRQVLIVDTGSRTMAFPCVRAGSLKSSVNCCGKHASPYFNPQQSTTYFKTLCGSCELFGSTCSIYGDTCELATKYTEGSSWSANEVQDMVWLGTPNVIESVEDHMQLAVPFSFGCQTSVEGLFKKQHADGILGMVNHDTSLIAAYYRAGAIPEKSFAMCLTPDGGSLSLGGSLPKRYHTQVMRRTPITREHGWYSMHVERLVVGDIEIASRHHQVSLLESLNAGKGCILDNGTTDTYLPKAIAKKFFTAVQKWTHGVTDFSEKYRKQKMSYEEYESLPEITFVFENDVNLTMHPKYYMEGVPLMNDTVVRWKDRRKLINRIYVDEKEGAVLGANALFGYDILFHMQDHEVGIAKANCEMNDS